MAESAKKAAAAPEPAPEAAPAEPAIDHLAEAQKKAPSLTAEFVKEYGLSDDYLDAIARGEIPPPPTIGPEHTVDLHMTDGGWQITPVGVKPEDVGKDAISR